MEQVSLVATLHRRSGSSVAEALDHVAEGARERLELVRELNSLTGQARLSIRILTGLPVVLFVAMACSSPPTWGPCSTPPGESRLLVFCGFMVSMGWLVMRRIVKMEAY